VVFNVLGVVFQHITVFLQVVDVGDMEAMVVAEKITVVE